MGIIAKPLAFLLEGLYDLIGNYGVAIFVMTVIIKLVMYPLYAKQIKSSMGMSELQPKVQEIQQRYAKDRELMNQKMMELYQKEGVSMYGGCLPMIIQMFIIMGLFSLMRTPMEYISSDKMLFAIHENFLWINDLAQPDPWILPLLAGVATFISFSMNNAMASMGGATAAQSNMMMKMYKYFFPIMILWMARSYPAGLAVYWFTSQAVQIFYNLRFNKMRKKQKMERAEREAKEKRDKEREKAKAKARARA